MIFGHHKNELKKMNKLINSYKPGDKVILTENIKDAYGEIWHEKGNIMTISKIASDGEGLMFSSDLGIHFTKVIKIQDQR